MPPPITTMLRPEASSFLLLDAALIIILEDVRRTREDGVEKAAAPVVDITKSAFQIVLILSYLATRNIRPTP